MLIELACGNCGSPDMRLKGALTTGCDAYFDLVAICQGCSCVTHLTPPRPTIELRWGDPRQGEKDDGILCRMAWSGGD